MANEIRVSCSLQIIKNNLSYRSPVTAFQDDMSGQKGPVGNTYTVSQYGVIVDLDELTVPGYFEITHVGEDGVCEYGLYDPQQSKFYPWGELGPGHQAVGKFSRNLFEEYSGTSTSTGTIPDTQNQLLLRAQTSDEPVVSVKVFEA